MKYSILFFMLSFSTCLLHSQTLANGYYILSNMDTVKTQIRVPRDLFANIEMESLERKIKANDSSSAQLKKLWPPDIKAYGFHYKDKDFTFVSKPLADNKMRFFEQLAAGKNASCYYYYRSGYRGSKIETYIVEKPNTETLVIKDFLTKKKIKEKLTDFFAGNTAAVEIINTVSISNTHRNKSLQQIIEAINSL